MKFCFLTLTVTSFELSENTSNLVCIHPVMEPFLLCVEVSDWTLTLIFAHQLLAVAWGA